MKKAELKPKLFLQGEKASTVKEEGKRCLGNTDTERLLWRS